MKDSIVTLLTSKRTMVAVAALILDAALAFGVELDPEQLATLLTTVTALAGVLIGGISVSDHGKALGQPAGVDHKGHGAPAAPAPAPSETPTE